RRTRSWVSQRSPSRSARFATRSRSAPAVLSRRSRGSGLVQLGVEGPRRLLRETRHALELFLRGLEEALDRAEVAQDRAPSHGTDPRERFEDGLHRLRAAPPAVVAERDAVRLVACPLQELQRRAVPVERDRPRHPGNEAFLLALREGD